MVSVIGFCWGALRVTVDRHFEDTYLSVDLTHQQCCHVPFDSDMCVLVDIQCVCVCVRVCARVFDSMFIFVWHLLPVVMGILLAMTFE